MQCPFCQTQNDNSLSACADCGSPLSAPSRPHAAPAAPVAPAQAPATAPQSGWQSVTPAAQPAVAQAPWGTSQTAAPQVSPTAPQAQSPANTTSQAPPNTVVVVEHNGREVLKVPVMRATVTIGRADVDDQGQPFFPDIDLTDADPNLASSRRHARLVLEHGQAFLEDLGSSNGTFVEQLGRLTAQQRQPLPQGVRAMFGRGGPVIHWRSR